MFMISATETSGHETVIHEGIYHLDFAKNLAALHSEKNLLFPDATYAVWEHNEELYPTPLHLFKDGREIEVKQ